MKKIIPNLDIAEIKENPYLPLATGYRVLRKSDDSG